MPARNDALKDRRGGPPSRTVLMRLTFGFTRMIRLR